MQYPFVILFFCVGLSIAQAQNNLSETSYIDYEVCNASSKERIGCLQDKIDEILVNHFNNQQLSFEENKKFSVVTELNANSNSEYYFLEVESSNALVKVTLEGIKIPIAHEGPTTNTNGDPIFPPFPYERLFELTDDGFTVTEITDEEYEAPKNVGFNVIEKVPVYPGCLGTNQQLKECMSRRVQEHIKQHFNRNLAETLDLSPGVQRIYVQFKINSKGKITDIISRGPHKALEEEAERVVNLLPDTKPGTQRGEPVNVIYSLPIVFEVEETKAEKKARRRAERKASQN
ncbi:energy transducer TonB [Luteirhabdus pelagi]|uniref:energy transducer TonB n=1 Tax=Luteirhabdus pelagi TaxID=2792783 RepID=UPI001939967E|nr:energy transducer TonB [Luteirhabdus pelagi]